MAIFMWRKILKTLAWCVLLVAMQALYCTALVWHRARLEASQPADAAVVLGAAAWGNRPSPVFRERIAHGITLYRAGRVDKLILTGGTPKVGYMTEAEVARRFALQQGVPAQDILFENQSRSTLANLTNVKTLLAQHDLHSVIIVSDPDHLARAAAMAQHVDLSFQTEATPSSRYSGKNRWRFAASEVGSLMLFQWWRLGQWLLGGANAV